MTIEGIITANCPGAGGCGPADFVFEPDYKLMPLYEVEAFVQREKHLPGVASAEEITAEGLNMTLMQMKLLEKVEELTLHAIAQQRRIDELTARFSALEK